MTTVTQVSRSNLSLDEAITFARHFSDLFTGYIVQTHTYKEGIYTRMQYAVIRFTNGTQYKPGMKCKLGQVLSISEAISKRV